MQASLEVLAALHQVLDVIDLGEEELHEFKECVLVLRQLPVGENSGQVAKVIAAGEVKGGEGEKY